ncbi:MAG: TerB family tellurite resistance protein [Parvularculales bacterium]
MLNKLRDLFRQTPPVEADNDPSEVHLACVCLMIRAARIDGDYTDREQASVRDAAHTLTGLTDDDLHDLIARAEKDEHDASDLYRWTRHINRAFTEEEKIHLLEGLWQIAVSEGGIHHYEANLLRRVTGLIYIPDRESGVARQRVMARLGKADVMPT